jgi:hypothetical protein
MAEKETKSGSGGKMTKNMIWFLLVTVVGALLGSFLGKFIGLVLPDGAYKDLFATDISAGLAPATLNLRIIDVTFGCMLKFNVSAVLGIIVAALIFQRIFK